jgi:hypothetical protein
MELLVWIGNRIYWTFVAILHKSLSRCNVNNIFFGYIEAGLEVNRNYDLEHSGAPAVETSTLRTLTTVFHAGLRKKNTYSQKQP